MNGHFEVDNTAYPIGYLNCGLTGYKVTDMRNLQPLHAEAITKEQAIGIASKTNRGIQRGTLKLQDNDTSVSDFVQQELENL